MSGTQRNSSGFFGLLMNEFFKISALIGDKLHRANWNYFSLFFLRFFFRGILNLEITDAIAKEQ